MSPNELTEWIGLFVMDAVSDGQGGLREDLPSGVDADTPARVEQQSASRSTLNDQTGADRIRYRITTRYQPGITRDYRVYWNGMYLDIDTIDPVSEYPNWLVLVCDRREAGTQ